ncbi:MAG: hypothetical protein H6595_11720 [Flavobacteriales bacterium]|nr:hypothetical protein [Flavobacteriales bacterium]
MKKYLLFVALSAPAIGAIAQYWNDTGNGAVVPGTNFLGSTNNAALDVQTNAIRRLTLIPDATYTIGSFSSLVRDGSLLLSPDVDLFYTNGGPGPFSLLHLADGTGDNSQTNGYRPWMRNGITFSGNSDLGYIGQKYTYNDSSDYTSGEQDDYTDMIINWSDNPGTDLGDRMPRYC